VTDEARPGDPAWLQQEEDRLLTFASAARLVAGGFGSLDARGSVDTDAPVETWINARMTYVFSLAALRGRADSGDLADHGVDAMQHLLRDDVHGGWFPAVSAAGEVSSEKRAYDHAFVVLAAAAATAAGRPGAGALLDEALACIDEHFWSAEDGMALDVWDRTWSEAEAYRGANANMHLVEAFLAATDVTGDRTWHGRALGIAERLVHGSARAHGWRLPEHYDEEWVVMPEYNRDRPADPFRPYGATVGHWLEWARLLCHLHLGSEQPAAWLAADAAELFRAAVAEGWAVDGADGFVYTVDWEGRPVVHARMHWVLAEALGAATVVGAVTEDERVRQWLPRWWGYAERHLVDRRDGSWHHELDRENRPAGGTWSGKPDVYHAYQAVLLTQLPPATSLIAALSTKR
jgi:sulfoquinovose isomerase